jgi:hypothetical protein
MPIHFLFPSHCPSLDYLWLLVQWKKKKTVIFNPMSVEFSPLHLHTQPLIDTPLFLQVFSIISAMINENFAHTLVPPPNRILPSF